jgi:hypothetical protein
LGRLNLPKLCREDKIKPILSPSMKVVALAFMKQPVSVGSTFFYDLIPFSLGKFTKTSKVIRLRTLSNHNYLLTVLYFLLTSGPTPGSPAAGGTLITSGSRTNFGMPIT